MSGADEVNGSGDVAQAFIESARTAAAALSGEFRSLGMEGEGIVRRAVAELYEADRDLARFIGSSPRGASSPTSSTRFRARARCPRRAADRPTGGVLDGAADP